jgi:predicted nucleic acid-binding protein
VTIALVDTSVLIHLYRKHSAALSWFNSQDEPLSVSSISWLEFIDGAPSTTGQVLCLSILSQLELIRVNDADQDWAMQQMRAYRLSKGVHPDDCLIASACHRLQVRLYTHNVKDMKKVLPDSLVKRPFVA